MIIDVAALLGGLALVLLFAGRLVRGALGFARGFGLSVFIVSVIFVGFDPENLAVGAVGTYEGAAGIALGTIIGAAMVAIALAFGITALFAPLRFEEAPRPILIVPVLAAGWIWLLASDGALSRVDGILLLAAYVMAIVYLAWLNRRGIDIRGAGLGKKPERAEGISRAKSSIILLGSLVMIVVGSELLVNGAKGLMDRFGLSQTLIGMTVIALAISIEELARELPAAMRGHPEIAYGNVAGSVLAFFLFNAGVIALIRPLTVDVATTHFYLPVAVGTVVLISALLLRGGIPRWAGALLVAIYIAFAVGGFVLFGATPQAD